MKKHAILNLVCLILVAAGGNWVSELWSEPIPWNKVVIGFALFAGAFWFQTWRSSSARVIDDLDARPPEPRPVLVLTLSESPNPIPPFVTISGDLRNDLARLAELKRSHRLQNRPHAANPQSPPPKPPPFWNWEQTLRAIQYNAELPAGDRGPLRRVVVIASKSSILQTHVFLNDVVRRYPALDGVGIDVYADSTRSLVRWSPDAVPLAAQNGVDFNSFRDLSKAYQKILRTLAAQGVVDDEILIDFTSGTKLASVVAAVVTISRSVGNQYVQTEPRDASAEEWEYEVLGYNLQQLKDAGV